MKTFKATFKYEDDTTRIYDLDVQDSLAAGIKDKVVAFNASLTSGTSGGLDDFFVSDSGASLEYISEARLVSVIETPISIPAPSVSGGGQ